MAEDGTLVKANQDWFPLFVETNSIGDITFTSSNPGVIAIEPNDTLTDRAFVEGKTDYGVGAKAKVLSAGKTTITATIKGTGAYASVTKSFDVYIFPDLAKKPQLSMTETAYDTSRADGIIRPGDTLRYIVTATNEAADTACINPIYELGIPADTTFSALTIVDPEGNEVTADYDVADGKVVVASLPTLFGGQAYRFKLDVTVNPDVVSKAPGEKPDFLSHSEATGIYGVNLDKFEWDDRIPAEGLPVDPADAEANPTLPPSPDAAPEPEPEPIVPDPDTATEILGGDLNDPEPEDPSDPDGPKKPGVPVGPVKPGWKSVAVTFDALVTEEAVGNDVGNTATAHGTLPSTLTPGGTKPAPGGPFAPSDGWHSFVEDHPGIANPQPTYPSKDVGPAGGIVAAPTGDGGASGADGDLDAKRAQTLRHLAQTGDEAAALALVAVAALMGGAAVLVLAARRRRAAGSWR